MQTEQIQNWSFLGTVPPPFGGVTVFSKRKIAQWRKQGKHVTLVDITRLSSLAKLGHFIRILVQGQSSGLYINNLSGFYLAAAALNIGGAQIFFHDHNYDLSRMHGLRGKLLACVLRRAKGVFFDGAHSRQTYIAAGLLAADKPFQISPPFIEPDMDEKEDILASYPQELMAFIAAHSPVIGANAFKIIQTEDGTDLYGVDMTIDLLAALRKTHPNTGVVFAVSVAEDTLYAAALKERLAELHLTEHFYFFTGTRELWPLFGAVDVMIRPTSTDGYGVSIAESLFMGTPAVASDVCTRPEGTTLFKARNADDLLNKVRSTLV
ncbi:MAG: glycosyltransferase [Proteobacteria bacterium]|nr:glycosyltransferase [Pseudomonadota bacterium]